MADTLTTTGVINQSDPAIGAEVISYGSVDQSFTRKVRGLHISTAGTLKVTMADGTVVSLVLAVGVYPYCVTLIWNSGSSTAAGHVLY